MPYLSGMSAGEVETSHDGKSMVYVKYPEGTLWRSAVDGTNRTPLTSLPMQTGLAHWSPDDKRIAFSASKPGLPANIYIVPAEGGVAERVSFGAVADLDASWSPDGRKLTFGGNASYMGDGGVSIQSLDLSTHEMTEVPGSRGICCPRWSPDGRFLVGIGGQYTKLMLFDFATRKWSVMREGIGTIGYIECLINVRFPRRCHCPWRRHLSLAYGIHSPCGAVCARVNGTATEFTEA